MSLTKRLLLLDGTENCSSEARMSALPPKADICSAQADVRFVSKQKSELNELDKRQHLLSRKVLSVLIDKRPIPASMRGPSV